jgi:uncharacterized protein YkwD
LYLVQPVQKTLNEVSWDADSGGVSRPLVPLMTMVLSVACAGGAATAAAHRRATHPTPQDTAHPTHQHTAHPTHQDTPHPTHRRATHPTYRRTTHRRTARTRKLCRASHRHVRRARRRCGGPRRALRSERGEPITVAVTPAAAPVVSPAAAIARVLARPCENTELMPEAGNLELVEAATLCLVNQERARNGELPLQPDAELQRAARAHSEDMVGEDYFAHNSPDGGTPVARMTASGYIPNSQVGYSIGENIAWGTLSLATPSSIVAAWIASPEHLANILGSEYRDTAVGVVAAAPAALAEGEPGAVYTQDFGVIER